MKKNRSVFNGAVSQGRLGKMKKYIWLLVGSVLCLGLVSVVFAGSGTTVSLIGSGLGGMASRAAGSIKGLATLITAGSYAAGLGFAVGAIVKLKAHKDNPTQVPLSMGIALLGVAILLTFIPTTLKSTGGTVFGSGASIAGVSGITNL